MHGWFFEVSNEPKLEGFWERADQSAYFELYARTARALRAIDPALKVGGPSTAGAAWEPEFLAHAAQQQLPVDVVTTHTYGVDGSLPAWLRRDSGRCTKPRTRRRSCAQALAVCQRAARHGAKELAVTAVAVRDEEQLLAVDRELGRRLVGPSIQSGH